MNDREKMLQRVLNLRARAEDDSSSEAETMKAIEIASKLMESYDISEAELALAHATGKIEIETIVKKESVSFSKGKHTHAIRYVVGAIANFTDTRCIFVGKDVEFIGCKSDTEFADYLSHLIREALDREYANYRASNARVGYGAKKSFQMAMVQRIRARLSELKKERQVNTAQVLEEKGSVETGKGELIVLSVREQKEEMVNKSVSNFYPRLGVARMNFSVGNNGSAYAAGRAAGNKMSFGKPVEKNSVKRIAC